MNLIRRFSFTVCKYNMLTTIILLSLLQFSFVFNIFMS